MKTYKNLSKIITVISFALFFSCSLQEEATDLEMAQATFEKIYPEATSVNWTRNKQGEIKSEFVLKGEKYEANFMTDGKWVVTEKNIQWTELPNSIQDKLMSNYDQANVSEIKWVDHYRNGRFYLIRNGENHILELDSTGNSVE